MKYLKSEVVGVSVVHTFRGGYADKDKFQIWQFNENEYGYADYVFNCNNETRLSEDGAQSISLNDINTAMCMINILKERKNEGITDNFSGTDTTIMPTSLLE